MQALSTLRPYTAVLWLRSPVCCLWRGSPFRGVLHPTAAAEVLQLRRNHTANYRGCAKWKEAKAAHAKRAPIVRSKVGSAPSPPVTPKAQRSEPTAEQERLVQSWNHEVRGGRVIKAASPPSPNPTSSPVTQSPRNVVETTGKKGKPAKSTPKVKVCPKQAQATKANKPAKPRQPSQTTPMEPVAPTRSNHSPIEEISDLLDKLPLNSCVDLTRRLVTSIPTLPS